MTLQTEFRESIGSQFSLEADGVERYRVCTPFICDDGDHLVIVLKREGESWLFSDEGHTMMWCSDRDSGTISRMLSAVGVLKRNDELFTPVVEGDFGAALFEFGLALLRVMRDFRS